MNFDGNQEKRRELFSSPSINILFSAFLRKYTQPRNATIEISFALVSLRKFKRRLLNLTFNTRRGALFLYT